MIKINSCIEYNLHGPQEIAEEKHENVDEEISQLIKKKENEKIINIIKVIYKKRKKLWEYVIKYIGEE